FALKSIERLIIRGVTSVTVCNGNAQNRAPFIAVAEQRLGRLDAQPNQLGDELEAGVSQERAGKQPGLARDLESVADREHGPASVGVRDHVLHHGTEARDGAGPQIVAVTESARQHDHVASREIVLFVPEVHRLFAERFGHGVVGVVVAVGAGKSDDAELHAAATSTPAISKSSVTGLARSRSHMSRVELSAAALSRASSSTTTWRPTCTSRTAPNPSVWSASATVLPCGSRMPRRGVMWMATRKRVMKR